MTITANATFQGTNVGNTDVDAPQLRDVLKEIAQDLNLLNNIATGDGTPPIILDHAVNNGAPIGQTLVNQCINRTLDMSSTDAATYGGPVYLWAAPVFFPENGTYYEAALFTDFSGLAELLVYSATGTLEQTLTMTRDDDLGCVRTFLQVSATAAQRFLAVRVNFSSSAAFTLFLHSMSVYRLPPSRTTSHESFEDNAGNDVTLPAVTAAGLAIINNNRYPPDEWFLSDYAVSSVLLKRLRDYGCKLYEYITGWPVDGNRVVTDSDSATVNPVTSRFHAHSRATYVAEPLIDWPLFAEGLGAVRTGGANTTNSTATAGLYQSAWFAPWVVTASINAPFHKITAYCPDFPTASNLKGVILYSTSAGSPGKVQGRITRVGGTTVSDLISTSLGSQLYCLNFTAVDFSPDALNTWHFEFNTNGVFTFNEANLLGVCLYFEP